MKTIVTHLHPDFDAVTSVWLIKRFYPDWKDAEITFVPAGSTLDDQKPDENPDIIHVDTGLGKFDHHQTDEYISATKKVFSFLAENQHISDHIVEALERLVNHVTDIDHFAEINFPDPTSDYYLFTVSQIIEGMNNTQRDGNKIMEHAFAILDSILQLLRNKIKAQEEIKKGFIFETKFGKSLAMETRNEETIKLGLKMGYGLVVRKDPEKGNIRIKTQPKKEFDLTQAYEKLKKLDPQATWFLHSSRHMLLNGSSKNPTSIPTTLPLKKVIEIIKEI